VVSAGRDEAFRPGTIEKVIDPRLKGSANALGILVRVCGQPESVGRRAIDPRETVYERHDVVSRLGNHRRQYVRLQERHQPDEAGQDQAMPEHESQDPSLRKW
jgi:hypothetical protein